jgi:ribosome maturation factor RimP
MKSEADLVVNKVADLIEPILKEMGFELVDVEFLSKHGKWVLQLFIDTEQGVTIDDCVLVSRELGDLIETRDIIEHEYVLEVSSPGIDRPLKKLKDFQWAVGKKIKVKTAEPVNGRRNFTGILEGLNGDLISIGLEGMKITLRIDELDKANLVYEF